MNPLGTVHSRFIIRTHVSVMIFRTTAAVSPSRTAPRRALIAFAFAAMFVGPVALAQEPGFTLADAAAIARRQHPLLTAAGGRRQVATGIARQESALPNPVFEWRKENLQNTLNRDEFVSVGLPVDLYGRRMVLRSASALVASRSRSDSSTTARDVEYDVARAYWRAALAFSLYDATVAQRLAFDTIARIETDRARQGQVPNVSAMRARLEADRARLAQLGARAELERARGDLARALAIPFDSVPRPTEPLQVDSSTTVLPMLDALLTLARAQRSELLAARARVDETSRRRRAERLGTLPAVGVQVGNRWSSGVLTNTVQVGVALPFFDRNGGNRERARGEQLIAEGDLRAAQSAVDAQVMSAYRAYRVLIEAYDRTADAGFGAEGLGALAVRSSEVAGISGVAYREGAIPLFELLDAERVRADVRSAALRAAADVHMARADLLRALGLPIDGTRFQLMMQ